MTSVDAIIIEKFYSPAAGFLQHRLGISQWRASMECLNGTIAFYLAGVAFTIAHKGIADGIFIDLLSAVAWLLMMEFVRSVAHRQAGSSMGVQTARFGEWIFRLLLITLLPFSLYALRGWGNLFYSLSLLSLISHLYFKACDTPPPERRRKLAYNHI